MKIVVFLLFLLLVSFYPVWCQELRDIKPPVNFTSSYFLSIVTALVALAAIGAFLAVYFVKKKKAKASKQPVEAKPAHLIAYEALTALRGRDLPQQGKLKEYYFELFSIVRQYLENRFSLRAPEMTTEEFLNYLRESKVLGESHKELLRQFLSHCDLVKFAKYGPAPREIEDSFRAAVRLIDETKEVPLAEAKREINHDF